jgi:hypothetical protein
MFYEAPSLDTPEGILVCTPKGNGLASPLRLDITTNVMNYGSICQNKRVITETAPDEDLKPCKKRKVDPAATKQLTIQHNLSLKEALVVISSEHWIYTPTSPSFLSMDSNGKITFGLHFFRALHG